MGADFYPHYKQRLWVSSGCSLLSPIIDVTASSSGGWSIISLKPSHPLPCTYPPDSRLDLIGATGPVGLEHGHNRLLHSIYACSFDFVPHTFAMRPHPPAITLCFVSPGKHNPQCYLQLVQHPQVLHVGCDVTIDIQC